MNRITIRTMVKGVKAGRSVSVWFNLLSRVVRPTKRKWVRVPPIQERGDRVAPTNRTAVRAPRFLLTGPEDTRDPVQFRGCHEAVRMRGVERAEQDTLPRLALQFLRHHLAAGRLDHHAVARPA